MKGHDSKRLFELFEGAVHRHDEERQAYLQANCRDAAELALVEELLQTDEKYGETPLRLAMVSDDMLGDVVSSAKSAIMGGAFGEPVQSDGVAGYRINNYVLKSELGRGGMGVVYLAVQQSTGQLVALKCLRPTCSTQKSLQRFEQEAQVLGRLDYVGVAKIYDAGQFETDGNVLHYFAMEYVRGQTLLEYAREQDLDLGARVALVASVCDAVQHAHDAGIIHRDLKPSNILVDESGQPKVLDFGVSRIVDKEMQATTMGTEAGQLIGTLNYMSPEQAGGDPEDVDESSDVYALGAILYELVSGQLPHDLDGHTLFSGVREIREKRPRRLTVVLPRVPSDIATIAERALEVDRGRRFKSAQELAEELRRFLRHEPIVTRPASTLYFVRKFARRHRILVLLTSLTLLLLVAVIVVSIFFHISQARSESELQIEKRAAEHEGYIANLTSVEAALRTNDVAQARLRLEAASVADRGWEWEHWNSRLDQSVWTFDGFEGWPRRVRFDKAGERLLVCSTDGSVVVLAVDTGRVLGEFNISKDQVLDAIFTANEEQFLTASGDGALAMWSTDDGRAVHKYAGHERQAVGLALIPGSDRFASISEDGSVRVWSYEQAEPLQTLMAQEGLQLCLAASPDGRTLATGGRSGRLELWDLSTGEGQVLAPRFEHKIESVEFSADGHSLAACGDRLLIYDLEKHAEIAEWNAWEIEGPFTMAFSGSDKAIPMTTGDCAIRWWEWGADRASKVQRGHEAQVVSLALSPDRSLLATASFDGTVKCWEAGRRGDVTVLEAHGAYVNCVDIDPSGTQLLSAGMANQFHRWNITSTSHIERVPTETDIYDLTFAPDGKHYALARRDNSVCVVSSETDEQVQRYFPTAQDNHPLRLAYHPGGRWLVAATRVGFVRIIDTVEETELPALTLPSSAQSLAVHPTNGQVVVGTNEGEVYVLDLPSGVIVRKWLAHGGPILAIAFSPDGNLMATASEDATIRLWSINGEARGVLQGHDQAARALCFSPDGTRLFSAGGDQHILVWSTQTWRELTRLAGHTWPVQDLVMTPDGSALVSAGMDGTVRVWQTR